MSLTESALIKIIVTTNPIIIDLPDFYEGYTENIVKGQPKKHFFYLTEAILEKGLPASQPFFVKVNLDISDSYNEKGFKRNLHTIIPKKELFNNNIFQYRLDNSFIHKVCVGRRDTVTVTLTTDLDIPLVVSDYSMIYLVFRLYSE
jgi:hypothetical protein